MKCLPQNQNTSVNVSFKSIYMLKGTPEQVQGLYSLIKTENTLLEVATDCVDFPKYNAKMIFTEESVASIGEFIKKQWREVKKYAELKINLPDIWNSDKGELLSSVVFLNTIKGQYKRVFDVKSGQNLFKTVKTNNPKLDFGELQAYCKFDKNISIVEAFQKMNEFNKFGVLDLVSGKKYYFPSGMIKPQNFIEMINDEPNLRKIKVNELLGAGDHSAIFAINDKKAIRVSIEPSFPVIPQTFDLPIRGGKAVNPDLYWCKTSNEQNWLQTRITQFEIKQLINKIKQKNFRVIPDLTETTPNQVIRRKGVRYNGKILLADSETVSNKDGTSRLYDPFGILW